MIVAILQIILEFFKIFWLIFNAVSKFNEEENRRFQERFYTIASLLKDAVHDVSEVVNEKDFIDLLAWEIKEKYEYYKGAVSFILKAGGGISNLEGQQMFCMGQIVKDKREAVLKILVEVSSIDQKSIKIAKVLIDDTVN